MEKKHQDYALCLYDISFMYNVLNKQKKGISFSKKAVKIIKDTLPFQIENSIYINSASLLARMYYKKGSVKKATDIYSNLIKVLKKK